MQGWIPHLHKNHKSGPIRDQGRDFLYTSGPPLGQGEHALGFHYLQTIFNPIPGTPVGIGLVAMPFC